MTTQPDLFASNEIPPDTAPTRSHWIRQHLITTGHLTENGFSRAVKATVCRRCHHPTLRALDADICALDVTLDPDPLDTIGELLAVASRRRTYDLTRQRGRYELEPREAPHIAKPRRYPVLVEHRCGAGPLPIDPTPPTPAVRLELPDHPPF